MTDKPLEDDDKFPDAEAEERFKRLLGNLVNTPHTPHKPKEGREPKPTPEKS